MTAACSLSLRRRVYSARYDSDRCDRYTAGMSAASSPTSRQRLHQDRRVSPAAIAAASIAAASAAAWKAFAHLSYYTSDTLSFPHCRDRFTPCTAVF